MSDELRYAGCEEVEKGIRLCQSNNVPCEVVEWIPNGGLRIGKAPTYIIVVQNGQMPVGETPQSAFDRYADALMNRSVR